MKWTSQECGIWPHTTPGSSPYWHPPGVCWQRLLCASPPPLQSGNKWSTEPAGLCEEDGGECASNASHPTSHTASAKTNVIIDCKNTNRELFENFKHSRKNRLLNHIHAESIVPPQTANSPEAEFSNEQLFPALARKVPLVS